jgi:hypothetical protein
MIVLKLAFPNNDHMMGAMAKALAVEIAGFQAVSGAKRDVLIREGGYEFSFRTTEKVRQFGAALARYLPGTTVSIHRFEP